VISGTRFLFLSITLFGCVTARAASDAKPFQARPAAEYAHQSAEQVTVGAKAYDNQDLTAEAFGKKADLLKYGVLPVLVVIENKRDKSIDLRNLEVSLVSSDNRHVAAVSPDQIPFLGTDGKHNSSKMPPLPIPLPKKKNPLNAPEITVRAFPAQMLAPGDSASGFFYFEARPESGDGIYLNGLRDARSGKEIMYFEFPLTK
jgi:hypothetical protein